MKLTLRETVIFGMLGGVMYVSKLLMEALPNIHLIGMFVVVLSVVYRKKALYPIYTFVFICGFVGGFAPWWFAYLYIWTVLWGAVMLLPKSIPERWKPVVYMLLCSLHGFGFGLLYTPAQALFFGMSLKATVAWWISGLPFDCIHGISNLCCGFLIYPLTRLLLKTERAQTKDT